MTGPPALDEVVEFWTNIKENDEIHNEDAEGLKKRWNIRKRILKASPGLQKMVAKCLRGHKCNKQNKQREITG